ncbi:TPA: hypothetical protein ACH3X1_013399 [Trebouxia sp. C0004]
MDNKSFTKHGVWIIVIIAQELILNVLGVHCLTKYVHLKLVVAFDEVWTSMRTETGPATTGVHVYITKDRKLQGHLRKAQAVANARAHELPL